MRECRGRVDGVDGGCSAPAARGSCVLDRQGAARPMHWFRNHDNQSHIDDLMKNRLSAVTSLGHIAGQLDAVQRDLRDVKDHGAWLRLLADQLNTELRKVKRSLLRSLENCDLPACIELGQKHHIQEFNTYVPHVQIPGLLLLGLPHCFFGVRPDEYGSFYIYGRDVGSRFIFGVILLSMISFVVCVVATAIIFSMATFLHRGVCDPLWDPLESSMFGMVDSFVDLEQVVFKDEANHSSTFKVSKVYYDIINPTTRHRSFLYWAFHIDRLAGEHKKNFTVSIRLLRALKEMQSEPPIRALPTPVKILSESAKRNLRRLANTRFSDFPIDRIPSMLKTGLHHLTNTSREMVFLADALERVADSAAARGGYGSLPSDLRADAAYLTDLRLNIILPIFKHAYALNRTAKRLQESLRFNVSHTSLEKAIEDHLHKVADAERFFNVEADEDLRLGLRQKSTDITGSILLVYRGIITRVLPKGDFFVVPVKQMRSVLCENILLSMHGMWISLAICWLILHALLLASRNLARVCLHTDPYPGPAVVRAYDALKRYALETHKMRLRGDREPAADLCATCNDVQQKPISSKDRYHCCD